MADNKLAKSGGLTSFGQGFMYLCHFICKVKNVAVFMGFDDGEQDMSNQETMNQWEPTTGSKNRTFRNR